MCVCVYRLSGPIFLYVPLPGTKKAAAPHFNLRLHQQYILHLQVQPICICSYLTQSSIPSSQSTSTGNSQILLHLSGLKRCKRFCKFKAHSSSALHSFLTDPLPLTIHEYYILLIHFNYLLSLGILYIIISYFHLTILLSLEEISLGFT